MRYKLIRNWPPAAKAFAIAVAVLCVGFAKPLFDLVRFATDHDLHSHIVLIPVVSIALIWLKRHQVPAEFSRSTGLAVGLAGLGLAALLGYWGLRLSGVKIPENDYLALTISSFCCLLFQAVSAYLLKVWLKNRLVFRCQNAKRYYGFVV